MDLVSVVFFGKLLSLMVEGFVSGKKGMILFIWLIVKFLLVIVVCGDGFIDDIRLFKML